MSPILKGASVKNRAFRMTFLVNDLHFGILEFSRRHRGQTDHSRSRTLSGKFDAYKIFALISAGRHLCDPNVRILLLIGEQILKMEYGRTEGFDSDIGNSRSGSRVNHGKTLEEFEVFLFRTFVPFGDKRLAVISDFYNKDRENFIFLFKSKLDFDFFLENEVVFHFEVDSVGKIGKAVKRKPFFIPFLEYIFKVV